MLIVTRSVVCCLLLTSLAIAGCGKSDNSKATTPVVAQIKLTSSATPVNSSNPGSTKPLVETQKQALTAGSAQAGDNGLTSLKYFIDSIEICESMNTTGTAYSNQTGCVTLYQGPTDPNLNPASGFTLPPDYAAISAAAATTTNGYIDLMDPNSRAAIATGGTTSGKATAGSYSWGLVNWAYPVKVTATIPGAGLYTQTTTVHNGNNGQPITEANTPLTQAPAAEAIVALGNGGSWFKLQHPFVISPNDVAAGTTYTIDLTFNPHDLIRGFAGPNAPTNLALTDGNNAINVPMLDLSPVPRKSTDKTYVETYTTTSITGTTDTFSLRLELYYNSADTAKSIYGATLRVIPTATTQWSTDVAKIAFIAANATVATDLDFQDYGQNAIIAGFTRQTTLGGTTTVTLPCAGANATSSFSPLGCANGGSLTATFQLSSLNSLE